VIHMVCQILQDCMHEAITQHAGHPSKLQPCCTLHWILLTAWRTWSSSPMDNTKTAQRSSRGSTLEVLRTSVTLRNMRTTLTRCTGKYTRGAAHFIDSEKHAHYPDKILSHPPISDSDEIQGYAPGLQVAGGVPGQSPHAVALPGTDPRPVSALLVSRTVRVRNARHPLRRLKHTKINYCSVYASASAGRAPRGRPPCCCVESQLQPTHRLSMLVAEQCVVCE